MQNGHEQFGQRLRALRKQISQTTTVVANAVGTTHSHLSAIELGRVKNPRQRLLRNLANHYGLTVSELTGEASSSEMSARASELATWFDKEASDESRAVIYGFMQEIRRNLASG